MLLTSKGSAGVADAGFVALAASLVSMNKIPVSGLVLLVGIDRFLNEARYHKPDRKWRSDYSCGEMGRCVGSGASETRVRSIQCWTHPS